MDNLEKLSNLKLTESILKKYGTDDSPLIQELLRRFDEALACLEQPNLYYKKDVDKFAKGEITSLQPK